MKFGDWINCWDVPITEGYLLVEEQYDVKLLKREKYRKINPKTNREKNFHKQRFMKTDIPPEKRSFKNIPKYATGKNKVDFKEWLMIQAEKRSPDHSVESIGKSEADGKWYGWSHRAVYGFKKGDEIKGDSLGKKVIYPKLPNGEFDWDNGKYEPDFVISSDSHAKQVAATFAENVS